MCVHCALMVPLAVPGILLTLFWMAVQCLKAQVVREYNFSPKINVYVYSVSIPVYCLPNQRGKAVSCSKPASNHNFQIQHSLCTSNMDIEGTFYCPLRLHKHQLC